MNLMELFVKITADTSEVDKSIGDTKKKALSFGDVLKANIAGQAIVDGVKAVAGAVKNIGESAIQSYADYEQLVGGVETLFEDLSWDVQQNAGKAFETAGLSANEYMNTAMSFAASLNQSLLATEGNIARSADLTDQAIIDMADNANKMGTSMEMIQNAYQGFAKQNYTMLDNLKLGYGGTKEEMQRLLEDAEKISGIEYDISSYADIVEAIHVMQTEMHISGLTAEEAAAAVASGAMTEEEAFAAMGTTAKEASTTIQGSLASMKGAWENLLTGVADDNANFEVLVNNFVDSLVVAGENIIPRINKVIQGLTQLITQASQTIIPLAVETLLQNLPSIVAAGMDLVMALVNGILDNMDVLIDSAIELIDVVVDKLIENLPKLIDGGVRLIIALAGGLIKAIPKLVSKIPEIISAIVKGFKSGGNRILDVGKNIVQGVWEGIKSAASWIRDKVTNFFGGIVDSVKDFLGIHSPSKVFAGIGGFMAEGLGIGFDDEFSDIKKNIENSMNFDAGTISGRYEMSAYSSPVAISEQNRVFSLLEKYLPMLANMKIVLDGGTVVGILAPEIDSALGKINAREARAV